jgi:hypothetical protein
MKEGAASTTKVLPCDCDHAPKGVAGQDEIYGRGKRLHNRKNKAPSGWKCTVCGKVKS